MVYHDTITSHSHKFHPQMFVIVIDSEAEHRPDQASAGGPRGMDLRRSGHLPLQFSQILHLLAGSTEKLNCRIMLKMKEFLEGPLTALWKIIQGICKVSDLT